MFWLHNAANWLHHAATFLAAFFCLRLHLAALVPSTAEKAAKILAGSQPTQPVDKGILILIIIIIKIIIITYILYLLHMVFLDAKMILKILLIATCGILSVLAVGGKTGAKEGYKISTSGLDALRRVRSTLGKNTPYPVVTRTWGRNLESFCLPAVACFDPIGQMGTSCWCTQCNSELKGDTNTDSWYRTFRMYGLQSAHLLSSFTYVCPNKQCVVKTCVAHRSKLSKLAATYFLYLILDEFGISFDVMNWLQDAVLSGQSFREFCFQLGRRYDEDATRCEMQFKEYKKRFLANAACTISFTADREILKSMRHVPSDDTVRRAMFERFWKVECFHRSQMAILPSCRLSADQNLQSCGERGILGTCSHGDGHALEVETAVFRPLHCSQRVGSSYDLVSLP